MQFTETHRLYEQIKNHKNVLSMALSFTTQVHMGACTEPQAQHKIFTNKRTQVYLHHYKPQNSQWGISKPTKTLVIFSCNNNNNCKQRAFSFMSTTKPFATATPDEHLVLFIWYYYVNNLQSVS